MALHIKASEKKFKAAFDFGPAYHLQFIEGREDDPYGLVVDRCARIAKLARPGAMLVTGQYFDEVRNKSTYLEVGSFPLKGLREKCAIYLKSLWTPNTEEYLQPLLAVLNADRTKFDGFRSIGRAFKPSDIRDSKSGLGRPFLARELLNLPKCPFSFSEFLRKRGQQDKPEALDASLRGQIVDWKLYLESIDADEDYLTVIAGSNSTGFRSFCLLRVNRFFLDTVKTIEKGTTIRVRGVLVHPSATPVLDYVDIEVAT